MNLDTFALIAQFHEAFGYEDPSTPTMTFVPAEAYEIIQEMGNLALRLKQLAARTEDKAALVRIQLQQEETAEFARALYEGSPTATLHELCDIRYVTDGTLLSLGLRDAFEPAFVAVHAANMSKLDESGRPIIGESGRVVKSSRYRPPDVAAVLRTMYFPDEND